MSSTAYSKMTPVSSTGQALNLPKKQRHTAKRIHERLRDEYGFDGGYTIVKDYVRKHRRRTREMFVPLVHPPGHAQCDFGEAWAVIEGGSRISTSSSSTCPTATRCSSGRTPQRPQSRSATDTSSAFSFLGGVPQSIVYDNTRLAVARILGDGRCQRTTRVHRACVAPTFSRTGAVVRAKARTRVRWRAWWGTCAATSWCRSRPV